MTFHSAAARALLQDADAAVDLAMEYTAEALPMSVRTRPDPRRSPSCNKQPNSPNATAHRATDELVSLGQRLRNRSYDAARCAYLQTTIVERFIEHPSEANEACRLMISRRLGAVLGTETPDPRHVSAPAHLADEPYTWLDTLTAPKDEPST